MGHLSTRPNAGTVERRSKSWCGKGQANGHLKRARRGVHQALQTGQTRCLYSIRQTMSRSTCGRRAMGISKTFYHEPFGKKYHKSSLRGRRYYWIISARASLTTSIGNICASVRFDYTSAYPTRPRSYRTKRVCTVCLLPSVPPPMGYSNSYGRTFLAV